MDIEFKCDPFSADCELILGNLVADKTVIDDHGHVKWKVFEIFPLIGNYQSELSVEEHHDRSSDLLIKNMETWAQFPFIRDLFEIWLTCVLKGRNCNQLSKVEMASIHQRLITWAYSLDFKRCFLRTSNTEFMSKIEARKLIRSRLEENNGVTVAYSRLNETTAIKHEFIFSDDGEPKETKTEFKINTTDFLKNGINVEIGACRLVGEFGTIG